MPFPLIPFAMTSWRLASNLAGSCVRPKTPASGVDHPEDKNPLAFVRRADLIRAEESALNLETQAV